MWRYVAFQYNDATWKPQRPYQRNSLECFEINVIELQKDETQDLSSQFNNIYNNLIADNDHVVLRHSTGSSNPPYLYCRTTSNRSLR